MVHNAYLYKEMVQTRPEMKVAQVYTLHQQNLIDTSTGALGSTPWNTNLIKRRKNKWEHLKIKLFIYTYSLCCSTLELDDPVISNIYNFLSVSFLHIYCICLVARADMALVQNDTKDTLVVNDSQISHGGNHEDHG